MNREHTWIWDPSMTERRIDPPTEESGTHPIATPSVEDLEEDLAEARFRIRQLEWLLAMTVERAERAEARAEGESTQRFTILPPAGGGPIALSVALPARAEGPTWSEVLETGRETTRPGVRS